MYLIIDMKSFFASVECALRGLNPLTCNLVVADKKRGSGALCLAVSVNLKKLGVKNRCRLFEIDKNIKYIIAKPRMKYYLMYANKIHKIFLKYFDASDIHTYSIDEAFIYLDPYLNYYHMDSYMIARKLQKEIFETLGIASSAGIGTNMYLAKIALDILAKNKRIAFLDQDTFINILWNHKPITDFWSISYGISNHLAKLGLFTMKDIAFFGHDNLIKEFKSEGEILYEHSFGFDDVSIKDIKNYKVNSKSLSNSQILMRDYDFNETKLIIYEMIFNLSLEMRRLNIDSCALALFIGFKNEGGISFKVDFDFRTNDYFIIKSYIENLLEQLTIKEKIRSAGISFINTLKIENRQISLFNYNNQKQLNLIDSLNEVKKQFGKNSINFSSSLYSNSTIIERNRQIGGHNEK